MNSENTTNQDVAVASTEGQARRGRSQSKDIIIVRTYVIPESVPSEIKFSRHMIRFVGLEPFSAGADLIWGVQGTTSLNSADAFASSDAKHMNRRLYQAEILYRLKGLPPSGTSVTEEFSKGAGYLHLSRLTKAYRQQLHQMMRQWLSSDPEFEKLSKMDLEDMVKNRPMLVHRLMKEFDYLNVVIHPVLLAGGVSLRIATIRNDPQYISRVYTRFHEEIVTTV